MNLKQCASDIETILSVAGYFPLGCVWDSPRALDIAAKGPSSSVTVVRCVSRAHSQDYRALGNMLEEGQICRAILVECDEHQEQAFAGIETCAFETFANQLNRGAVTPQ